MIDQRIDLALARKLTDSRIVEIDIQEKVIERLSALAKIVGIPIALLVALLGLWGVKSLSDVDEKVKKATDDAVTKMNMKVAQETDQAIAGLKKKVDEEDEQIVQQARQNAKQSLDVAVNSARKEIEAEAQGSRKRIDELRAQLETQATTLAAELKSTGRKTG